MKTNNLKTSNYKTNNLMITTKVKGNKLQFFMYNHELGEKYLLSKTLTPGLNKYFMNKRHINELYKYHGWGRNDYLDGTIQRILKMVDYLLKEEQEDQNYVIA